LLLLQEFDITIKYRPDRENLVVDFLSQFPKTNDSLTTKDQFPDEHLFVVSLLRDKAATILASLALIFL
jgi:hypothetical protein